MSDRWILTVPVISTAHLREETYARLLGEIAWGRRAGAISGEQCWVFVGENTNDEGCELHGVCAWAREEGYEYVRFDGNGDRIESLPTYNWGGGDSDEPTDDDPGVYQRYDLYTQSDGTLRGLTETNDDNDDGIPDTVERWEVSYADRAHALRATGGSHIGANGCKVEVFIDGDRV